MLLVHFLVAFAIFFPIVLFVITLYRAYQEDGNPTNINMFLGLLLLLALTCSCTKEDLSTTCDGDCSATMVIPGNIDPNGYYHVSTNDFKYFNIDLYATPTSTEYHYNGTPYVSAEFTSDNGIVQETEIYFRESNIPNKLYTKRIVGPVLDSMVRDTVVITAEIFWDAGSNSKFLYLEEKIIIE